MPPEKELSEFPNVHAKLTKPTKISAFEKQRAEAEAKRQREAAETAAVYEDFIKSFDHDESDGASRFESRGTGWSRGGPSDRGPGFGSQAPLGGGAARRHFGMPSSLQTPKSGPGSLGPSPSSFGRKRSALDAFEQGGRRDERGFLGFDDRDDNNTKSLSKAFHTSDDEEDVKRSGKEDEAPISRPTLRLAQLPPGTSPAMVKSLIPSTLVVDNVNILATNGPSGTEKKCTVAIVTLSQDTPANEIDSAVSLLQNRYLGWGYYLSLHRHLSSAVSSATAAAALVSSSTSAQPFGAQPVSQASLQNRPPHYQRGFAPPSSYAPPAAAGVRANLLYVSVKPPQDIRTVRMINKVIELVLEHGPEFEALLMTRPDIQKEEKWAWIWDARSEGGIWYRWKLWEVITGSPSTQRGKYVPLFEDSHAWKAPDKPLAFEYATNVDEFVSDSEYASSDDDELEGGEPNRENPSTDAAEKSFLNPLEKARLTHLLARLPTTLSKIRKGDIARVTAFAITHASRGADEVVDMVVSSIEKPFSLTGANPSRRIDTQDVGDKGREKHNSSPEPEDKSRPAASNGEDVSGASLVSLYAVSDILSSSSTSGIRHAWRFRQLFEVALREHHTFEKLGSLPARLGWGRLRAEKWKRSVGLVLNLWEGWCVFPAGSQALFTSSFESPPDISTEDAPRVESDDKRGKWKVVESIDNPVAAPLPESTKVDVMDDDVEGIPMDEDVEGEPMDEEDIEGEPMDEEDIEGEPMDEEDIEGEPMDEEVVEKPVAPPVEPRVEKPDNPPRTARKANRMRAADMFAD